MSPAKITEQLLMDHVRKLGDEHPPISFESVDFTVNDPDAVRTRYAGVLDYLARVELEVDRNVLELLTIMPNASEVDRAFYSDVWYDQEMQHGRILDRLKAEIGLAPADPLLEVGFGVKVLGALARFPAIEDVARTLYYFTGASTERQAVLAYNAFSSQLGEQGERAMAETVINPIKRQEPGHFAFYQMSATKVMSDGSLRPWQVQLARLLRERTFELVGTHRDPKHQAEMGEVIVRFGFDAELEEYAQGIGRLEARLLWANRNGMEFPPYFLKALRESVELYRERGTFTPSTAG